MAKKEYLVHAAANVGQLPLKELPTRILGTVGGRAGANVPAGVNKDRQTLSVMTTLQRHLMRLANAYGF